MTTAEDDNELMNVKEDITRFWNAAAPVYDQIPGHDTLAAGSHDAWLARLAAFVRAHPTGRVLDIGTGTGFLARLAAELGHEVVGIDASAAMLAVARSRPHGNNITFLLGTAEDPPIPDASFDAVVSRHLLWTLPDPDAAIARWKRALRPGGRVVAFDGCWFPTDLRSRLRIRIGRTLEGCYGDPRDDATDDCYEHLGPAQLPLRSAQTAQPAADAFLRAGLRDVRFEYVDDLDRLEFAGMPLRHRLAHAQRRYVVEGRV